MTMFAVLGCLFFLLRATESLLPRELSECVLSALCWSPMPPSGVADVPHTPLGVEAGAARAEAARHLEGRKQWNSVRGAGDIGRGEDEAGVALVSSDVMEHSEGTGDRDDQSEMPDTSLMGRGEWQEGELGDSTKGDDGLSGKWNAFPSDGDVRR